MRCFIAVDIPADIKSAINGLIRKDGPAGGLRWVPECNMHLTLKFLGDVSDDRAAAIVQKLRDVVSLHSPFPARIEGTGAFPNIKRPNVLWVGFERAAPLKALFLDMEAGLAELGIEKENRPFSPHLTIGRVRDLKGIDPAIRELSTYKETFFGTIDVHEILLMKSILKPEGAEYSRVAVLALHKE
jgi:RNA 2',3'-cyclic 3'-phosphodiesterase